MNLGFAFVALMSVVVAMTPVVVVVVVVLAIRSERREEKTRRQAVATLCAQHGFVPGAAPSDFPILGALTPELLSNSFSSPDHGVIISDLFRPSGRDSEYFTILSLTVAGVNMPQLAVRRRNAGALLLGGPPTLGLESVELESIDFDQQFTVKTKDKRSAVMLMDEGTMQLMLDCKQVGFDMLGDKVLAFIGRGPDPGPPVEFELLFKFGDAFGARVPSILRSEYPAAQSQP